MPIPFGDSFLTDVVQPELQDRSHTLPTHAPIGEIELASFKPSSRVPEQSEQAGFDFQASTQEDDTDSTFEDQTSENQRRLS